MRGSTPRKGLPQYLNTYFAYIILVSMVICMNEKFIEFFKDPSAYIKRLLQESLDEKWYEGSREQILSPCPFCLDAFENECSACLCPPEICNDHGYGGEVGFLVEKYEEKNKRHINDILDRHLHGMLTLFKNRLDNVDCD